MAPTSKNPRGTAAHKERRRSDRSDQSSLVVTLHVSSDKLQAFLEPPASTPSATGNSPAKESPAPSATVQVQPGLTSAAETVVDSAPDTPAAGDTPVPGAAMGPPPEGPKKKGVKRGAGAVNGNGEPKARGKPGPKSKKQKLEDGTLESGRAAAGAAHKPGPKANQGAINAGLRALDRSGKPCRKWAKGGFQLKSFTGVVWGVPRWTAPPRPQSVEPNPESASASAPASAKDEGSSNKENKESQDSPKDASNADKTELPKSEVSNPGGDTEMQGTHSAIASSPTPVAVAAV